MSCLRLVRLPRSSMIRRSRMFSDPFFSDPFFSDPFFTRHTISPASSLYTQRHVNSMNEMLRDFAEMLDAMSESTGRRIDGKDQQQTRQVKNDMSQKNSNAKDDAAQSKKSDDASVSSTTAETTHNFSTINAGANAKSTRSAQGEASTNMNTSKTSTSAPNSATSSAQTQVKPAATAPSRSIDDFGLFSLFELDRTSHTYNRAEKLFSQVSSGGTKDASSKQADLALEETDALLSANNDFAHLFKSFAGSDSASVRGSSYESSTIYRNGKSVTVSKYSTLDPNGSVRTEVNQEYVNDKGEKDKRRWVKEEEATHKKKMEGVKEEGRKQVADM